MSKPRPLVDKSVARQLLKWQLLLAGLIVAAAFAAGGLWSGYSAAMGSGIALAGTLYFAWQAFRFAGATAAKAILNSFYRGEAGKFFLTVLLFGAVFLHVKAVQPGWLFAGFALPQLAAWVVMIARRD